MNESTIEAKDKIYNKMIISKKSSDGTDEFGLIFATTVYVWTESRTDNYTYSSLSYNTMCFLQVPDSAIEECTNLSDFNGKMFIKPEEDRLVKSK